MKFLRVFVNVVWVLLAPIWSLPYLAITLSKDAFEGSLSFSNKFFWE